MKEQMIEKAMDQFVNSLIEMHDLDPSIKEDFKSIMLRGHISMPTPIYNELHGIPNPKFPKCLGFEDSNINLYNTIELQKRYGVK